VSPAGDSLTILLSLYSGGREFATGTLVFDKCQAVRTPQIYSSTQTWFPPESVWIGPTLIP